MAKRATLEKPNDMRQAILDAARRLFSERSPSEVSTAELCRASGATNGSLFHFFPKKDQLVAALYLEALERYQEAIASRVERAESARAGVEGIVLEHVRWVTAHPDRARVLHEMRRGEGEGAITEALRERNAAFASRMGAWFTPHVRQGRVRALPPDVLIAVVFGPVHMATRDWLRGGTPERLHAIAPALAQAAWAALRP